MVTMAPIIVLMMK